MVCGKDGFLLSSSYRPQSAYEAERFSGTEDIFLDGSTVSEFSPGDVTEDQDNDLADSYYGPVVLYAAAAGTGDVVSIVDTVEAPPEANTDSQLSISAKSLTRNGITVFLMTGVTVGTVFELETNTIYEVTPGETG